MALSDSQVRSLQPRERQYKCSDERGLFILVRPNGSKLWRHRFRFGGKEKLLSYGRYPEVSLADARRKRDDNRRLLADGIDPALERRRAKAAAQVSAEDSFEKLAEEYLAKRELEGLAEATLNKNHWFLSLLKPKIGSVPISQIEPQLLLDAIKAIENRGNYETAKKTRSFASRVFRYAVAISRANNDPADLLKSALTNVKARHYSAVLKCDLLGEVLDAIDRYSGHPGTCFALKITPHVFLRPGELRKARWEEIDLEGAIWTIPAERMKARKPHSVPLSKQVVSMLDELGRFTGRDGYVFPSAHNSYRPLSENGVNQALRRMGYGKDTVCAHGFRATASTFLNESGKWNPDAIERALAHGDSNAVRAAYHRSQYWDERVKMAQWWSDFLEDIKA